MTRKVEHRTLTQCRLCQSKALNATFDFGPMPLVDSFLDPGAEGEERVPLKLLFCEDCALSQLEVVVAPAYLYRHYVYHSSVSRTFQEHCRDLSKKVWEFLGSSPSHKALDIASNDGCLMREFQGSGFSTFGVEPATNLCRLAEENGFSVLNEFWGRETAGEVLRSKGKFDVVTATNVLAHVPDIHGFVSGVEKVLSENGVFVVEVPYMRELVRHCEFDTIMHEHLSYFLLSPLVRLFAAYGLAFANVESLDIHGGSLRLWAVREENPRATEGEATVEVFLRREREEGFLEIGVYSDLFKRADSIRRQVREILEDAHHQSWKVGGYGASGKGNIFVNYCGLTKREISYIVDETPSKQGKLYPGTQIPIVPFHRLQEEPPQVLLLLAWNFAKELMEKTHAYQKTGGKYLVAIPEPKII